MTPHPKLQAFNFKKWVEDHADKLKPPVGNQLLHKEGDMIVMVVRGKAPSASWSRRPASPA